LGEKPPPPNPQPKVLSRFGEKNPPVGVGPRQKTGLKRHKAGSNKKTSNGSSKNKTFRGKKNRKEWGVTGGNWFGWGPTKKKTEF